MFNRMRAFVHLGSMQPGAPPQTQDTPPPAGAMPSAPAPNANAPSAAPMMTPQSPEGDMAQSRLAVSAAVKILQGVAARAKSPAVQSPLVNIIAQLTKAFGPFDPRLSDTEVMNLIARSQGPGSPGNTPTPPPQGGAAGAHPKKAAAPQGGGAQQQAA